MPLPDEIQQIRMLPFPPLCRNEAKTSRIKALIDEATKSFDPTIPLGNLELVRKMTTGVQLGTVLPVVIQLLKKATVKAFEGSKELT